MVAELLCQSGYRMPLLMWPHAGVDMTFRCWSNCDPLGPDHREKLKHDFGYNLGSPRLSLTKYFCDRFSRVSLTIFFSRWLHLNNLCRESIAQDCMQVLQIFRDGYI